MNFYTYKNFMHKIYLEKLSQSHNYRKPIRMYILLFILLQWHIFRRELTNSWIARIQCLTRREDLLGSNFYFLGNDIIPLNHIAVHLLYAYVHKLIAALDNMAFWIEISANIITVAVIREKKLTFAWIRE